MTRAELIALIAENFPTNGARFITAEKARTVTEAMVQYLLSLEDDTIFEINGTPVISEADAGKPLLVGEDGESLVLGDEPILTNAQIIALVEELFAEMADITSSTVSDESALGTVSVTTALNALQSNKIDGSQLNTAIGGLLDVLNKKISRTAAPNDNVFEVDSAAEGFTSFVNYPEMLILKFTEALGLPDDESTIAIDELTPMLLLNQQGEGIETITEGKYIALRDIDGNYRLQGVDVAGSGGDVTETDVLRRMPATGLHFTFVTSDDSATMTATNATVDLVSVPKYFTGRFPNATSALSSTSTFNANSTGAKSVKNQTGGDLSSSDIVENQTYFFVHDAQSDTYRVQGIGVDAGASALGDLSDVSDSTPTNKNVLIANGDDWESRALEIDDVNGLESAIEDIEDEIRTKHPAEGLKFLISDTGSGAYVGENPIISEEYTIGFAFLNFNGVTNIGSGTTVKLNENDILGLKRQDGSDLQIGDVNTDLTYITVRCNNGASPDTYNIVGIGSDASKIDKTIRRITTTSNGYTYIVTSGDHSPARPVFGSKPEIVTVQFNVTNTGGVATINFDGTGATNLYNVLNGSLLAENDLVADNPYLLVLNSTGNYLVYGIAQVIPASTYPFTTVTPASGVITLLVNAGFKNFKISINADGVITPDFTGATDGNSGKIELTKASGTVRYLSFASGVVVAEELFEWLDDQATSNITITNVVDNGSGLCRVTATAHGLTTGNTAFVDAVVGVVGANGTRVVTVIDANTVDLEGTSFSGSYVSGGTIRKQKRYLNYAQDNAAKSVIHYHVKDGVLYLTQIEKALVTL